MSAALDRLAGRCILFTGAAGGLGRPTVLAFLREGARVVAVDNDPAKLDALRAAADMAGLGARLVPTALDLSDLATLRTGLDNSSAETGGFDTVINNAAIYPSKPFEDYTIEEIQHVQRVNVDAGIVCVQAALSHMRAREFGRIVNVASVTLSGGWALLSPYVQSKGALLGLTRAWAREFGPYGVTVNAIAPGAFPTDAEAIHPDPESYQRYVLERQAVKRRGMPDDMANALLFLIAAESGFVTGQMLNVDGGWWMG
ncbi:SDR family NAD(P)-dependent oxidoreductase [Aureimonas psammosilenae]|uniref:SDR family NAD(P)-dependent oxidoreductase n=1 Tax=Aureimonas psammosilenae TaxID=2495496 RepID=UPI0012612A3F|nr:SDR family oxidoreductase [Aureimonas psammosilenae]